MAKSPANTDRTNGDGSHRPSRGQKSAAVRSYLSRRKNARPTEVVQALGKKGIEVSASMVSVISAKLKIKKATRQVKRGSKNGSVTALQRSSSSSLDAALLLYKAARGHKTDPSAVRDAFLNLVEAVE